MIPLWTRFRVGYTLCSNEIQPTQGLWPESQRVERLEVLTQGLKSLTQIMLLPEGNITVGKLWSVCVSGQGQAYGVGVLYWEGHSSG